MGQTDDNKKRISKAYIIDLYAASGNDPDLSDRIKRRRE